MPFLAYCFNYNFALMHKNSTKKEPSKLKVAVICISLAKGGAEKSTAFLTKMLDANGMDVHVVAITDAVVYDYAGTLFNLGKHKSDNDGWLKRFRYLKNLRNYLKTNGIDIVIDNRTRSKCAKELLYFFYVYSGVKIIYVVRSAYLQNYFPKCDWLAKKMINRSAAIVGVSKGIANKINLKYRKNKAIHLYNSITTNTLVTSYSSEKHIVFLGRIDNHAKNFELLLDAYFKSKLFENNITLKIYGNGPDEGWLKSKIKSLNLERSVKLFNFEIDIEPILNRAYFLVLTSNYEGFPRVLIEALSCGTPVISVDCESGPNEIIMHEHNGLLVENHNVDALANAFNRFIIDQELYNSCKTNAQASVSQFNQEIIAKQWQELLTKI